jgi:hypothetical protein
LGLAIAGQIARHDGNKSNLQCNVAKNEWKYEGITGKLFDVSMVLFVLLPAV